MTAGIGAAGASPVPDADLKLHAARDASGDWERYAQLEHEFVRRVLRAALAP